MAFFTKGILLEQHKEPMLTRNVLIMRQEYEYFDCDFPDVPVEELSAQQIIEIARLAGIVDESDGLPLADKLEKTNLGKAGTMVVDAVDDEPYVSSQMCMVLHQPEKLALGVQLAAKAANPGDVYIAVYKHIFDININLPKSINDIRVERIGGLYPAEDRVYRHIPKGKNRLTVGACAMVHLARAVEDSRRMTSAFITVAGDAVANPRNVEVPIGTSAAEILELCGLAEEPEVIVMGGSMTGRAVFEPEDEKIGTTTRAVLAFTRSNHSYSYNCIGCGRCDHACPQKLSVSRIRLLTDRGRTEGIKNYDVNLCTGCGACSYVCPARIDVAATVLKAKKLAAQSKKEGTK